VPGQGSLVTTLIVAGVPAAFLIGVTGYALGSFLLMGSNAAARKIGVSTRELLRELWAAAWTQALLPLFYLVGRRLDRLVLARRGEPRATEVPVVFVHGYVQNRVCFLGLARGLLRRGFAPLFGINYPWFASLASNAARLDRFVEKVCAETGSPSVDLVCHSMGGLVAVEMMRTPDRASRARVRRCVTIATPHGGVVWQGPMLGAGAGMMRRGSKLLAEHAAFRAAVPFLSIFSTHDNIVHPKETSQLALRGGKDIEVEGVAHLAILFSPRVADHVSEFLSAPDPAPREVAVVAAPPAKGPVAAPADPGNSPPPSGRSDGGA